MATNYVVASNFRYAHQAPMLSKAELLVALRAKGITNAQMERALDKASSRVSEIMRALPDSKSTKPPRELTYDEGVTLARAFGLDGGQPQSQQPPVLPPEVLRLVARYLADSLGADADEELLQDLSEDLRAFAVFAADPTVRKTLDMAEGFFRGLRLRRQEDLEEAPPGSGPDRAH